MKIKEYLPITPTNIIRLYYNRLRYSKCRIHSSDISKNVEIGENCLINKGVKLANGVKLGKNTYINSGTFLGQNTVVGNYCSISYDCKVGLADHPHNYLAISPYLTGRENILSNNEYWHNYHDIVQIGHDVWIGANAVILQGVKIGNGAVIGAGAVVTKDVEPYSIVVGVPAKQLKKRFKDEEIKAIQELNWWDWDFKKLNENKHLFKLNESWKEILKK